MYSSSVSLSRTPFTRSSRVISEPSSSEPSSSGQPSTKRKAAQEAQKSLNSLFSSQEKQPSLSLQNVQINQPVEYQYIKETINEQEEREDIYFNVPFPIFKANSNCFIKGALTAQFNHRPMRAEIVQAIKENIQIYKRRSGARLETNSQKIKTIFCQVSEETFHVEVSNVTANGRAFSFNFFIALSFSSRAVSKASQVFLTLKLGNRVLSEDMLVEETAEDHDLKLEGTREFEEWEKNVCWYQKYEKMITSLNPYLSEEESEKVGEDIEEDLSQFDNDKSSPVPTTNLRLKRKRLISSNDNNDLPEIITSPLPTKSFEESEKMPPSSAQANAKKIGTYASSILESLRLQEETDRQKDTQIEQLTQQLATKDREKQELEKQVQQSQDAFHQQQLKEKQLKAEIKKLKTQLATLQTSSAGIQGLEEKLKRSDNAYLQLRDAYNQKKQALIATRKQLETAETAITDYKSNLDEANKAFTNTKNLLNQANQAVTALKASTHPLKAKLKTATSKITEFDKNHLQFKTTFKQVAKDREELQQRLKQTNNELNTEKAQVTNLSVQLKKQTQKLETSQREKNILTRTLAQQINEQETTTKHQQAELDDAKAKNNSQEKELNQLRAEAKAKNEELDKIHTELQHLKSRWANLQNFVSSDS